MHRRCSITHTGRAALNLDQLLQRAKGGMPYPALCSPDLLIVLCNCRRGLLPGTSKAFKCSAAHQGSWLAGTAVGDPLHDAGARARGQAVEQVDEAAALLGRGGGSCPGAAGRLRQNKEVHRASDDRRSSQTDIHCKQQTLILVECLD